MLNCVLYVGTCGRSCETVCNLCNVVARFDSCFEGMFRALPMLSQGLAVVRSSGFCEHC